MSEIITSQDDLNSDNLRVGAICTVKGKLEAVRYGDDRYRKYHNAAPSTAHAFQPGAKCPGVVLTFADWSMMVINIADPDTARAVRIDLRKDVTVKAKVIDEDGTLEAIAIWTPGGAPMPLVKGDIDHEPDL